MARMPRMTRSPRDQIYNRGGFYQMIPIGIRDVAPGETMANADIRVFLESEPVTDRLVGAYVDVRSFYIPYRLLCTNWPEWLMGEDQNLDGPRDYTNAEANRWFGREGAPAFHPAAAMKVWQAYFGTRKDDALPGITSWGSYPPMPLADRCDATENDEYDDVTTDVSIPVTDGGTASATVSLDAIEQAQTEREELRLRRYFDGDYMRYLAACGVSGDDQALQMPEPIFRYRRWVKPEYKLLDTGDTAQAYRADLNLSVRRKRYFPEHGVVMTFMTVMPKIYLYYWQASTYRTEPAQFPTPFQPDGAAFVDANMFSDNQAAQAHTVNLNGSLFHGKHLVRGDDRNAVTYGPSNPVDARWAGYKIDWTEFAGDNEKRQIHVDGVISYKVRTPLRPWTGMPYGVEPGKRTG